MVFSAFAQDLRYSFRSLLRSPRFALPAILAIAIGIGAATAVFSVVDRILFRDPPYAHADRLVSLGVTAPILSGEFLFAKYYEDWKQRQTPFESITGWGETSDCDLTDTNPQRLTCAAVDQSFLSIFAVTPLYGRNFDPEEDRPNAPRVALISYGLWTARFARDRNVLNRNLSLDGQPTRIIGVLPRDFELPNLAPASVIVPLAIDPAIVQQQNPGRTVRVFGRLKPGVSLAQAEGALQPLFHDFVNAAPPPFRKVIKLRVRSLKDFQTHDAKPVASILFASVLALLLIVCANVGNLMLARGVGRRREFAVRSALGATPWRLISERMAESIAVSMVGCVVGCAIAFAMLRVAIALAPQGILRLQQAPLDSRVLLFSFVTAIVASLLAGIATALEKPHPELLTGGAMQTSARSWARSALLAAQIGVALMLVTNAVLLVRSLYRLQNAPTGIGTEHVMTAELSLGVHRYANSQQRITFYDELERRVASIPGVTSYAVSDSLPPMVPARSMPYIALQAQGRPGLAVEQGTGPEVGWRAVSPGYFGTLSIPLLRGRPFGDEDLQPASHTIVVNQRLAQLLFGGDDAVGQHLRFSDSSIAANSWMTVVGVVANAGNEGLGREPSPEFFLPRRRAVDDLLFRTPSAMHVSVAVRSPIADVAIAQQIREAVAELDPVLPVETASLQQRVAKLAERPRFNAALLAVFATIALLLATIGVYSVIALVVAQRTREIGIRMAIGATPMRILQLVLSQGMTWVVAGALVGVAGTLTTGHYLRALLFGVSAHDPGTLIGTTGFLLLIAMLAIWIPAQRAAQVDPMVALRHE